MIDMLPDAQDEFYIGYEDRMPIGISRRVIAAVVGFACAATVAVAVAVLAGQTLSPSRFEFGVDTAVTGVLRRMPYPSLERDGHRVWLVGTGKFGAESVLRGIPDGPVTVHGSRIQRGRHEMLEVHAAIRANPVAMRGEIVDSKCFLGVMNPGEGNVHRDCATRCLRGGMPPMLRVRDERGREELVVLVSADGRPIGRELGTLAGQPIEVTGRLSRDGDDYVLFADLSAYRLVR